MSAITNQADFVSAPEEGQIRVLALSTSASALQTVAEFVGHYVSFVCDADFYITFGSVAAVTDPDETTAAGNGRTWFCAGGQRHDFRITQRTAGFKAKASAGTPKLRWTRTSARGPALGAV